MSALPGLSVAPGLFETLERFPVVIGTATDQFTGSGSHSIDLPSGVQAGDLLILSLGHHRADRPWSTPSGWTKIAESNIGSTSSGTRGAVFYRFATGSEGATVSVTAGGDTAHGAAHVLCIRGAGTPYGAAATGNTNTPYPPSLAPPLGAKPYLWLACMNNSPEHTLMAYPSGFEGGITHVGPNLGSTSVDDSRNSVAYMYAKTTGLDPDGFSLSNTAYWVAVTVAVPPA